jgi:hypothetical protein
MDAKPLLDPKNDFVFKRLFADAPDLLAALINAVRSSDPPVQVVASSAVAATIASFCCAERRIRRLYFVCPEW